jgi:hypothetical protein
MLKFFSCFRTLWFVECRRGRRRGGMGLGWVARPAGCKSCVRSRLCAKAGGQGRGGERNAKTSKRQNVKTSKRGQGDRADRG